MQNQTMYALGTQRSVIRELFEYGQAQSAKLGAEKVFDFSIGNPSVPPPPVVTETAIRLLRETDPVLLHGYTANQGDPEARRLLAESLNRRFGCSLGVHNLYLTAGAAAGLCCVFRGLSLPEQNEFVTPLPCFPEYRTYIENNGGKLVPVAPDLRRFQLDLSALEKALSERTRAVLLNSPNNPSGAVYSRETLEALAALLTAASGKYGHPIYLISDEPYREIAYDGLEVPWLPGIYPNTLVCYSFSKSLSLPGERMGYVAVPDSVEEQAAVFAAIWGAGRSMGYVNASCLFQRVCALCADETADLSVYAANRDLLRTKLSAMGYEMAPPMGTFYLLLKTPTPDDREFVERAKRYNLLVVPGSGFGCPGFVRLSYCVPTRRVEQSLPAFQALWESYSIKSKERSGVLQ